LTKSLVKPGAQPVTARRPGTGRCADPAQGQSLPAV